MLRKGIRLLAKSSLLFGLGALAAACTNEMVPVYNPPQYQNQLVQGRYDQWQVVPIQCPILYDQAGHLKPSNNFGCANVHNLGMMIANPADLLGSTYSGNIILQDKRKPLIYRNQPIAKSAQKYYNDTLPKVQDTNQNNGLNGGVTNLP